MGYTIGEAADRTGLTAHTLRFYDKEGLLPFVERSESGNRDFKEQDFEWLAVITCLKQSGMPVKQIRQFIEWNLQGDRTLHQRLDVVEAHKQVVEAKIAELQTHLKKIDHKVWYYQTAVAAGTEAIHRQDTEEQ